MTEHAKHRSFFRRKDHGEPEDRDEAAARRYGAEHAPDDSAPDIVARGAEKDEADAEKRRRRGT